LIFLGMLFSIEVILPEKALIGISLTILLTTQAFKCVRAWFTLFHFKSGRVSFQICFVTPSEVMMVLGFVRAIAFDTSRTLYSARKSSVTLFPTILVLEYF